MLLRFTKMHGLGNDFMVLDLVSQHAHILPKHAKQWGDRHTGVGFDQLLLVEAPTNPDVDFRYRIFNSDGSEVEQCGNGARCFARFVLDKRLTMKRQIRVETAGGIIELDMRPDGQICVNVPHGARSLKFAVTSFHFAPPSRVFHSLPSLVPAQIRPRWIFEYSMSHRTSPLYCPRLSPTSPPFDTIREGSFVDRSGLSSVQD